MNEKKICFITCVNNENQYDENILYIKNLNVPNGYDIETIAIRNANSMTSGYNKAISMTDAKYKVFTHQDVIIINKNFIYDMIKIFKTDVNIGLMGVVGTKQLPVTANWWESRINIGMVYENHTGTMELLKFDNPRSEYEEVQAVDGLILVTQHDVKWREDLFNGFHFYDISQCMEFKKVGFKVVIPRQQTPWVLHDCGFKNDQNDFQIYEGFRNKFLDYYSSMVFPFC